jgi:phosphatidylglycerophosphate synthase
VLLGRELLVTTLRGESESAGYSFGAEWSGKLKMVLQSITILMILVYVNYLPWLKGHDYETAARNVRDVFIYLTILVTVLSGLSYIRTAVSIYQVRRNKTQPESASK